MKAKEFIQQPGFIIQWHPTERCNWHCKHCYQETPKIKELTFKQLKKVFSQCLELFRAINIPEGRAHINIGGGEPFLRKDLFKLLELMKKYSNSVAVQIMTNGYFITEPIAKDLKKMKIRGIQVSLEGMKDINDQIRGEGSFDKTIKAIKILRKHDIITRVSLTLTRLNLDNIEELAIYLKSMGANALGIRRYVPIGRGKQLGKFMLSPLELKNYYLKRDRMRKKLNEREKFVITYGCEDGVFSAGVCSNYLRHFSCGVIKGYHLNIFANGDILACRRFPVVVGNVLKNSLLDIYFTSDKLWSFRDTSNAHSLCKKCSYFKYCKGGAKCITYSYFKTPFAPDPQCWRVFKKLPPTDSGSHRFNRKKLISDAKCLPLSFHNR